MLENLFSVILGVGLGVSFMAISFKPPEPVKHVVEVPPSDDQLVEFWFGNGDKAALRKRICK